jgi:hypothetical protein
MAHRIESPSRAVVALVGLLGSATLACIAYCSIRTGSPALLAPFPIAVALPAMLLTGYGGVAFLPLVFAASLPLISRYKRRVIPILLAIVVAVGCMLWMVAGWDTSAAYNPYFSNEVWLAMNLASFMIVLAAAWFARRRPNWWTAVAFQWSLFAWLAWCAFPWVGEI